MTTRELLIIGIFLSSFFSCNYPEKILKNYDKFLLYKAPNFKSKKDSIVLYEIYKDTIFLKSNLSYWSSSNYSFSILRNIEKHNFLSLIDTILMKESNYKNNTIRCNNNENFYEIKKISNYEHSSESLQNYQENIFDTIFKHLESISSNKIFSPIKVYYPKVQIRRIVHKKDTISLSSTDAYLIWKGLNTQRIELKKRNETTSFYKILSEYDIEFDGKKISNLMTINLNEFIYEYDGKNYSFKIKDSITLPAQVKLEFPR